MPSENTWQDAIVNGITDELRLLGSLLCSLDITVLLRLANDAYRCVGCMQPWARHHLSQIEENQNIYRLNPDSTVLVCFVDEIAELWCRGDEFINSSGPWIENINNSEDEAYRALAINNDKGAFLLLFRLGADFLLEKAKMQHVRDDLLAAEVLKREVRKRTLEIRKREEEIVTRLLAASGARDDETGAHVRRIGLYCELMGKCLGWDVARTDDIRLAATMHDIGKIGVPDVVFLKPGKLDEHEWDIMKTHAVIGGEMLKDSKIPLLQMASDIACFHHERYDGSGYVEGLSGENIPITARMTAIADVYDALVHRRVYKAPIPEDEVIKIMKAEAGKHFDPYLLKLFFDHIDEIRAIHLSNQD